VTEVVAVLIIELRCVFERILRLHLCHNCLCLCVSVITVEAHQSIGFIILNDN